VAGSRDRGAKTADPQTSAVTFVPVGSSSVSGTSSAPSPADSDGASATTVRLTVRTTPESATLLVDGEPQSLPYQGRVTRGASVHVLARAPGFIDYDRTMAVDEDTNLDIGLSRGVSRADGAAGGKGSRKRRIDDGDPYRR
jgi:hypothetical protein